MTTNIFIFRCADPKTSDYHYYFATCLTQINSAFALGFITHAVCEIQF